MEEPAQASISSQTAASTLSPLAVTRLPPHSSKTTTRRRRCSASSSRKYYVRHKEVATVLPATIMATEEDKARSREASRRKE